MEKKCIVVKTVLKEKFENEVHDLLEKGYQCPGETTTLSCEYDTGGFLFYTSHDKTRTRSHEVVVRRVF